MRRRTIAREHALKILYQKEITQRDPEQAARLYWEDDQPADKEVRTFANRLVHGIFHNIQDIDNKISQYAANWQLTRMAIIDRNVLRLGVYELLYASDIPPIVSINEAVELAKKYGDHESSKFVNGILDKIHKIEVIPQNKKLS